jgi:hypothetical protein
MVPGVRLGVSGAHGTGKTTLISALCDRLPGHTAVDEPYLSLEEDGYEFAFPPTVEDYRAQLARARENLTLAGDSLIFDRTPLDFLAYLIVAGCPVDQEAVGADLSPLFASLDALILVPITHESRRLLPRPDLPELSEAVDDALLTLTHSDPLDAWPDMPILQLDGSPDGRLETVLQLLQGLRGSDPAL